jgi:hypothetical protein
MEIKPNKEVVMSILSRLKPKQMVIILALGLMLGGAFALPAQATTLDFTLGLLPGGTVSFAGGLAPLIGAGIDVSFVVDKDTTNLPIPVTGGVLSFTTGPLTGSSPTEWDFGGGASSTIKITGAVPAAGITNPSTVLLTGTFDLAKVIYLGNPFFVFNIAGAVFQDTKDPSLLRYFDIAAGTPFAGTFNLSFNTAVGQTPPSAFASTTMGSGNLFNVPIPIPLPSTLLLLGTGLVGLAGLRPWRQRQG